MTTSLLLCVLALGQAGAPSSEAVLARFLAEPQTGMMLGLGDALETFTLTEAEVQQLLQATQREMSEERRIVLWQALRCSRSRAAREYLLRNVADDADPTMQIRFVQSLTQLAPFDVPILTQLYQRGAAAGREPDKKDAAKQPTLQDEILKLATRDNTDLAPEMRPLPDDYGIRIVSQGLVNDLRKKRALAAQADLLVWLAKHPASEAHRLVAVEGALQCLEGQHQKEFARDVLALVEEPEARAALIPRLYKRYAFDPFPVLVDDQEPESVKLAVLRGLHMFASSYGYSSSTLNNGQETLEYVSQTDKSEKVREGAKQMLRRIDRKWDKPDKPK